MDYGAYVTVLTTLAVAIVCGIASYRVSIRQAKREIDEAFAEHIERMHIHHQEFVQAVQEDDIDAKKD